MDCIHLIFNLSVLTDVWNELDGLMPMQQVGIILLCFLWMVILISVQKKFVGAINCRISRLRSLGNLIFHTFKGQYTSTLILT